MGSLAISYSQRRWLTLAQPPITAITYAKGWCSVHFVQHQIPKGGASYSMSVPIKDANGNPIGMVGDHTPLSKASSDCFHTLSL